MSREELVRTAISLSGASPSVYDGWTDEQLRTFIKEVRKWTEPPEETSTHPSVWGKKLTVGNLMPKEEEPEHG